MLSESIKKSELTPLPNTRPKHKESLEIAALTAEFLANGGKITNCNNVKNKDLTVTKAHSLANAIWDERKEISRTMVLKSIKRADLARTMRVSTRKIVAWLSGNRIPDNSEKELIKKTVDEWSASD